MKPLSYSWTMYIRGDLEKYVYPVGILRKLGTPLEIQNYVVLHTASLANLSESIS